VLGGVSRQPTLLLFVSPRCPACDEIAGAVAALAQAERKLTVLALSTWSDEEVSRAAADRWWQGRIPLILLPAAAVAEFQVQSAPFAIVLDRAGVVCAKGIVNQVEHLHSLLNALESGYATTDQFELARQKGLSLNQTEGK
jgi:methylamine dehydrogenase accessory protein MauD